MHANSILAHWRTVQIVVFLSIYIMRMLVHWSSWFVQILWNQALLWLKKMDQPALVSFLQCLVTWSAPMEFHSTSPHHFECYHLLVSNGILPSSSLVHFVLCSGPGTDSCHWWGTHWKLWNWTCLWVAQWYQAE